MEHPVNPLVKGGAQNKGGEYHWGALVVFMIGCPHWAGCSGVVSSSSIYGWLPPAVRLKLRWCLMISFCVRNVSTLTRVDRLLVGAGIAAIWQQQPTIAIQLTDAPGWSLLADISHSGRHSWLLLCDSSYCCCCFIAEFRACKIQQQLKTWTLLRQTHLSLFSVYRTQFYLSAVDL